MKVYQDINLLPDAEIGLHFLWEKVYQQVHLALVEMQDADGKVPIGIALPAYDAENRRLGHKLRLLAETERQLEQCNVREWLSRLSDYVHLTQIRAIPDRVRTHAYYRRIQSKSSSARLARLARRKAERENIGIELAIATFENCVEQRIEAPFVWMKSQSSGERFRLFIEYVETGEPTKGGFSTYGLSHSSSVPVF
ncbi:type I-F CRISPR-associated endoribonuclease Cas6/Csy4 [Methylomicrobium agile]|uniref:type I-F CRISPR-associated endoribonuclease Cas6/Csy4 n=1 Tax=Methylomicrobium agile TaxID=39774 RepID=UPI0004DF4C1A|nr:type I-F CRISPR-associated endoribonuclease Cas6/Csy4 [Methylomicrobium agile]